MDNFILKTDLKGDIETDCYNLLNNIGLKDVADHTLKVANICTDIAKKFNIDEKKAYIAGCLHDIGNIIPLNKRIETCNSYGINVLKEECTAPGLLHQKLSRFLAKRVFTIQDSEILNAIECHSVLKKDASKLDLLLLVSDKLSWDKVYSSIFYNNMINGLEISLEKAAFEYLKYLFTSNLDIVYHPWAIEAYNDLTEKLFSKTQE